MKYKVKYEIDVDADTHKEAALQVEEILKNAICRPFLTITDTNGITKNIDLETDTDTETDTETDRKPDKVCISVSGGCAEMVEKPSGVEVEIRDYDVQEVNVECKQDENGDWYQQTIWEAKEVIA